MNLGYHSTSNTLDLSSLVCSSTVAFKKFILFDCRSLKMLSSIGRSALIFPPLFISVEIQILVTVLELKLRY